MNKNLKNKLFQPIIPKWLFFTLLIIWIWQVIVHYYSRFPLDLEYLITNILTIFYSIKFSSYTLSLWGNYFVTSLIFCWLVFLAFCSGEKILKWLKIGFNSLLEEICFSLGLGWGLLAYLSFILGILGLLKIEYYLGLFLPLSVLGLSEGQDFINSIKQKKIKLSFYNNIPTLDIIFLAILGLVILINFINALCPEVFYDSLAYHLAAPSFFIQEGKITKVPFEVHSNLPSNMAMLYTFCLLLRDENLAKLVHFSFGILTVLGIISFARRFFNLKTGIIAATIFYTVPMVSMNSWAAAVDLGLTFFVFLSFYSLAIWIMSLFGPNQGEPVNGWFILSAVLAGLGLGTKYTAVLGLVMLGVLIAVYYKDKNEIRPKAKQTAIFLGIVFLIFLPWILKNLYFTGDPVFPYLKSLTPEGAHLKKFISATREYFTSFKDYLIHPWALTMGGDSNASFIGPIFLVFAPLLLFFKNKDKITKILLIYFVGFWFLWSLSSHMLRFLIPGLPIFSILIAVYIFKANLNKIFKTAVLTILIFLCLANLYWIFSIFYTQEGWKVVTGDSTKEYYLSYPHFAYGAPYFKVADYINKNLPPQAKILLIGECRGYYIKRKFITNSVYDKNPPVEWTRSSNNSEDILLKMKEEKITHILLNKPESIRLQKEYNIFYFNETELKIFNEFWNKYPKLIYSSHRIDLYELQENRLWR